MTTTAILSLVERGDLGLDEPVYRVGRSSVEAAKREITLCWHLRDGQGPRPFRSVFLAGGRRADGARACLGASVRLMTIDQTG